MSLSHDESRNGKPWLSLLICLTIAYAFNFVTLQAANAGLEFWFQTLPKKSWTLPTVLFAPVWTVVNGLLGLSAWNVYRAEASGVGGHRVRALILIASVLTLVTVWAWLFFHWHTAVAAMVVSGLMVLAAFGAGWAAFRVRAGAGWFALPALAWCGYLTALSFALWRGL
jgi:tryptophan-rich sensory protein